jgi:hypothetical protein
LTGRYFILFFLPLFALPVFSQDNHSYTPWNIDTSFVIQNPTLEIELPERHKILPQSLIVYLNKIQLFPDQTFKYDKPDNKLIFYTYLNTGDSLRIKYQVLPIFLKRKYSFFLLDTLKKIDETTQDTIKITRSQTVNPFADVGGSLKKSGSIVRGVKIGNNRDLTLNSGLNLQLSGQLTDDVEIVAALTDESTPIQPEGNTQTLREVDKVFINFNSPWISGTLGDFNLQYQNSHFANISRKLQGITLLGNYDAYQLGATVGTTRGFFQNLEIVGQEANQGPYQLTGKNGEREIIVLAGTERIWINGEKLTRGEINDYTIEYGNGQVTFTNKRLITSESRIEIDFEYYPALQKYTRNVYSGLTTGKLLDNNLKYVVKYYHEADDPDKLLEAEGIITDEENDILKNAGDNPFNAFITGAIVVDSLGFYNKIDTVINSQNYQYYEYDENRNGNYSVSFSYVGVGKGDYERTRIGVYRWKGIGKGSYLPIKLLPLPSKQQMTDIQLDYSLNEKVKFKSEYVISTLDQNILSRFNDKDNVGQALKLSAETESIPINLFKSNFGKISIAADGRFIENNFNPVDRINQPEFNRYWNLSGINLISNKEKSWEAHSKYNPWEWIAFTGNLGLMDRDKFSSFRYRGGVEWDKKGWFRGKLSQENVESEQRNIKDNWLRQKGHVEKDIGLFQPGISVEHELRENFGQNGKSGFDFIDMSGRIGVINHQYLSGYLLYSQRKDNIFNPDLNGKKIKQATSYTKRFRMDLAEWNNLSGSFELVLRKKDYTSFFENTKLDSLKLQLLDTQIQDTVWQDRETNLVELILNNHQWKKALDLRWQYRISTEQLALREKIYLDVGEGRGNLTYDENLQEYIPDPDGNFILYIVPSGKFEPVTNLETALRLKLEPDKFWRKPTSSWQKILTALSSESYVRLQEETKEANVSQIYLLNLSKFQKDSTLRGSIVFNEDLYVLKRNRGFSFRLRYKYRDDKSNQYLDPNENEDRQTIERGIRASYKVFSSLKAQSELRQKFTVRKSQQNNSRNRNINSFLVNQDFSYKPSLNWEFGIDSEFGFEKDLVPNRDINLQYAKLLARINYSILKKGRISTEYEYQDVNVINNPNNLVVPFEMARGKKAGVNQRWQLRSEYTVAENVVFTLFYSGRDDANFDKIIHTGQAEIRAYF